MFRIQKTKSKEKILKEDRREKYFTYRRIRIRITRDLSAEIMYIIRECSQLFKYQIKKKKRNPATQNCIYKDIIQKLRRNQDTYSDKQKLKKSIPSRMHCKKCLNIFSQKKNDMTKVRYKIMPEMCIHIKKRSGGEMHKGKKPFFFLFLID